MKEEKEIMEWKKMVFIFSCLLFVCCLAFLVIWYVEYAELAERAVKYWDFDMYDKARLRRAKKMVRSGSISSVVSGIIVGLMYTKKLDVVDLVIKSKEKIRKKLAKTLKQILDEKD